MQSVLDNRLSTEPQVTDVFQSCSYQLRQLGVVRRHRIKDALRAHCRGVYTLSTGLLQCPSGLSSSELDETHKHCGSFGVRGSTSWSHQTNSALPGCHIQDRSPCVVVCAWHCSCIPTGTLHTGGKCPTSSTASTGCIQLRCFAPNAEMSQTAEFFSVWNTSHPLFFRYSVEAQKLTVKRLILTLLTVDG